MSRKFWIRTGLVLLALAVVLYVAFWVLLFNPLEGSVERLDALVPSTVSWYAQGPWGEIRDSELVREHLYGSTLMTQIDTSFDLEQYLYQPIRQLEDQVNAQVPGFLGKFSVEDDILGREVALAGNFTRRGDDLGQKILNSPWLALTRISFKARFMDVLKFEAVRSNVPGLKAYRDFYEYDVGRQAIREGAPESARYFYFQRVKDVLILSNNRDMMEAAVHFGRGGGISQESLHQEWWYYYDTQGAKPPMSSLLWAKIAKADNELGNALEAPGEVREGSATDLLRAFFPIGRTISVTLRPGISGPDTIPLRGAIRLDDKISKNLYDLHRTEPEPFADQLGDWASYLPADRTISVASLKMTPIDLLTTVFGSLGGPLGGLFEPEAANGTPAGTRWTKEEFANKLGELFEAPVRIAFTRLPEVEEIDLDRYEGGKWKPLPGVTAMMTTRLKEQTIIDFFFRNKDQFGGKDPEEVESPVGRAFLLRTVPDATMHLLRPGFAVVGDRFFFSTNIEELVRLLRLKQGEGASLADRPDYREALDAAFDAGNLFLYVNMPVARKYLLDQRWQYAFDTTSFDPQAFRKQTIMDLLKEHPKWTNQQRQEAADEAYDAREQRRRVVEFPTAIQEYRNRMVWYDPFRWISLSDTPGADAGGMVRLDLKGAIRLQSAGD